MIIDDLEISWDEVLKLVDMNPDAALDRARELGVVFWDDERRFKLFYDAYITSKISNLSEKQRARVGIRDDESSVETREHDDFKEVVWFSGDVEIAVMIDSWNRDKHEVIVSSGKYNWRWCDISDVQTTIIELGDHNNYKTSASPRRG